MLYSRALCKIFILKIHLKQNFHGTAVVEGQKVEAELTVFTTMDEKIFKIQEISKLSKFVAEKSDNNLQPYINILRFY